MTGIVQSKFVPMLVSTGAAYSGWTPANASAAPYCWFVADDPGNVLASGSYTASGIYTSMIDKSGNGRTANVVNGTLVSATSTGINGRSAIKLIGGTNGDGFLVNSSTSFLNAKSGVTIASVYDMDTQASLVSDYVFFSDIGTTQNTGRAALRGANGATLNTPAIHTRRADGDSAAVLSAGAAFTNPVVIVASVDFPTTTGLMTADGTSTASSSSDGTSGATSSATNSTTGITIGRTRPASGSAYEGFHGLIGEVIAWEKALSSTEQQKLEGYLAWTWGLTANLPSGHPYKTSQPPP